MTPSEENAPRGALVRFMWLLSTVPILLGFVFGLEVLNNNFSVLPPTKNQFLETLDHALDRGTGWVLDQYPRGASGTVPTQEGRSLVSNAALAHMVVDCSAISSDPRMKQIASSFVEGWRAQQDVLARLVDPSMRVNPPTPQELSGFDEYQRWIMHGAAPDLVPLGPAELTEMFSPDKHRTGEATHQLLALYFYRKSKGSAPELDRLMNIVEERIATEAAVDFRVTDLYLQRIAFLLASDRPDLVRARWVERALAAQQTDGGWLATWHGWTRTPYIFAFDERPSNGHSTAQGLWMACMLKNRYPEWVERHYK